MTNNSSVKTPTKSIISIPLENSNEKDQPRSRGYSHEDLSKVNLLKKRKSREYQKEPEVVLYLQKVGDEYQYLDYKFTDYKRQKTGSGD